jgi:ABC-2 type transport system ATP-binding protein
VILLHQGEVLGQGTPQSFSERMAERSYSASAPGIKNRVLQERLQRAPGVIDAVIQRGRVRLVMASTLPPDPSLLVADLADLSLEPVAARFEDCFIAELRAQRSPREASLSPTASSSTAAIANEPAPVIQVRNVERRFGDFYAVKNISFDVRRGEIFGLLGANGAGKTTTFRMLCGLLPPSAGTLTVSGLDLRRAAAEARAKLGYMAQKFSLYGNLSVQENLSFFSSTYGLAGHHRRERLDWALSEFELAPLADAISSELPLGYKQRLALACALMHEPEILFLDEPTSGVDPLARRDFWRRINALAEAGVTVLVTTHFMEEAEYCDRLAIMAAGEILILGELAEIKAKTRTPANPDPSLEDAFIALIEQQPAAEANG